MRVLLDTGVPRGIASVLQGRIVTESRSLGWDELKNADLLDAAESAGFVVLGRGRWRLIRRMLPQVVAAVNAATPGSFTEVGIPDE
jgi:hypothetical protein